MAAKPAGEPERDPNHRPGPEPSFADFERAIIAALDGAALALLISIGHRTGLFDVMAGLPPADADRIAAEAGLCALHVRQWLASMSITGVVVHDAVAGTYRLPSAHAASLSRSPAVGNLSVETQWIAVLAGAEDQVVESFGHGHGVPASAYARFPEVMAAATAHRIVPRLVSEILPLVADLPRRLHAGSRLMDVECGSGGALIEMASIFRGSQFVGCDRSAAAIAVARNGAERRGLRNVRFETRDIRLGVGCDVFDAATAFNALGELSRPAQALAHIAGSLRPGGMLLLAEPCLPKGGHQGAARPLDAFLHAFACLRSLPVLMADGATPECRIREPQEVVAMLDAAGFVQVRIERLESDPFHHYFIAGVPS